MSGKFSRLCGKFPDCLGNFQLKSKFPVYLKNFRLPGLFLDEVKDFSQHISFPACRKSFKIVWKVSIFSRNFRVCLESFQINFRIFKKYKSFPPCLVTFQVVWKVFQIVLNIFQIFWKVSSLSRKLRICLESFQMKAPKQFRYGAISVSHFLKVLSIEPDIILFLLLNYVLSVTGNFTFMSF